MKFRAPFSIQKKGEKMKYSNYYNFEGGNSDIFTRNYLLGMTLDDIFKNDKALAYQFNTIGIPSDDELTKSPNAQQYTDASGKSRWRAGAGIGGANLAASPASRTLNYMGAGLKNAAGAFANGINSQLQNSNTTTLPAQGAPVSPIGNGLQLTHGNKSTQELLEEERRRSMMSDGKMQMPQISGGASGGSGPRKAAAAGVAGDDWWDEDNDKQVRDATTNLINKFKNRNNQDSDSPIKTAIDNTVNSKNQESSSPIMDAIKNETGGNELSDNLITDAISGGLGSLLGGGDGGGLLGDLFKKRRRR